MICINHCLDIHPEIVLEKYKGILTSTYKLSEHPSIQGGGNYQKVYYVGKLAVRTKALHWI